MKDYFNNIFSIKKAQTICSVFFITIVLLAHVNFVFSDYITIVNTELIEFSDQCENEDDVKNNKNYDCIFRPINYGLYHSEKLIATSDSYTLHNQHIDVFTPPPEH
jgi:hypothetical protein